MHSRDICPICIKAPLEKSKSVSNVSWIQCEHCDQWYHSKCVNLGTLELNNLHSYHCDNCAKSHGPSTYKRKSKRSKIQIDYVALNDGDAFAVDKSSHPHVANFHAFEPNASETPTYINTSHVLTKDYAFATQMIKPILVPQADLEVVGMSFATPPKTLTLNYITEKVGEETSIEVMDVLSQQGVSPAWNMGRWRDYFNTEEKNRDRIRNVISLEISSVDKLGKQFVRPKLVRELDLVDKVWDHQDEQPRSKVTKYCLMSVKESFTDFHIDFGGTSVYYTVCSGSKTFLMFPPSEENLELYESWCLEQNQNFIWFVDYQKAIKGKRVSPSNGFKVTLTAGDVFIIPSGWIHAVYTPEDSIVIGGNFLTLRDMQTQLKISAIEKSTNVPSKFRFPMFNKVLWLTSWYYLNHRDEFLRDVGSTKVKSEKSTSSVDGTIKVEIKEDTKEVLRAGSDGSRPQNLSIPIVGLDETPKNGSEKAVPELEILNSLINHLSAHYETSKTNPTARRSIPTNLIGKDVPLYIATLRAWADTYQI